MNRDEKKAFDAMLAEVEDSSDSDADPGPGERAAQPKRGLTGTQRESSYSHSNGAKRPTADEPSRSRNASADVAETKFVDEEAIEKFGEEHTMQSLDQDRISAMKRWLMRPLPPSEGTLLCYVDRSRPAFSLLNGGTVYRMYIDDSEKTEGHKFLMAGKKKSGKGTSYYLVSTEEDPDDRGSNSVLGKVRANGVGSRYMFTDHGLAADKTESPGLLRKELGVVDFEFDSGGPSKINAWLPRVTPSGVSQIWQPRTESETLEACIDSDKMTDRLIRLVNKKPKWDEAHGGHVLNFQGRVTEASVKNFQLCCANIDIPDEVVLQFGRVGKDRFTLDLKYPMSPFQAFCICVACMDGKIADRKGYEYMKKLVSSTSKTAATSAGSESKASADSRNKSEASLHNHRGSISDAKIEGSISGAGQTDVKQSTQYMRDKINRTFK